MISPIIRIATGLIGVMLLASFVLGLSHSISTGFAGFWGGFPFMVITIGVLAPGGLRLLGPVPASDALARISRCRTRATLGRIPTLARSSWA